MKVGERDNLGRVLRLIRNTLVLVRSKQDRSTAICEDPECNWTLHSKNAMGVGAQHAATYKHPVVVRREMVTEYDGKTPSLWATGGD